MVVVINVSLQVEHNALSCGRIVPILWNENAGDIARCKPMFIFVKGRIFLKQGFGIFNEKGLEEREKKKFDAARIYFLCIVARTSSRTRCSISSHSRCAAGIEASVLSRRRRSASACVVASVDAPCWKPRRSVTTKRLRAESGRHA